jgi:hypothetical protein
MKHITLILSTFFILILLSSCGSNSYSKRKGCKGTGSWSGNRNLGAVDKVQKETQKTYVWVSDNIKNTDM